ncbi:hypothetical protein EV175_001323 [Coemansia sp. RSA 1933]|nr:hypothetical protein EV175_001323 [Coemansia sp. RSA 1933]
MVLKPFKSPTRPRGGEAVATPPRTPTGRRRVATTEEPTTPLRSLLTPNAKRQRIQTPGSANAGAQRLVQERAQVLREVARVREEIALLERARALQTKGDPAVVGALISKWQVACAAASDDLFALLQPAMEAQRQAAMADRLFGSAWASTEDDRRAAPNGEPDDTPIDVGFMLTQFGIDVDLF